MREVYKLILVVLVWLTTSMPSWAQQRPVQSLYMFDRYVLNPAFAGSQVQFSATVINRQQWVNFPGAPNTTTFSIHSGFFKSKVGLGLLMARDVIGVHEDVSVYAAYSYKINLGPGILHMGLQGGFNSLSSDYSSLDLRNPTDNRLIGQINDFNPNFGTGIYFNTPQFYAGFSVPYILNNNLAEVGNITSSATQKRNYYIMGGRTFDLSEQLKFSTSLLFRMQEGSPLSLDLNGTVIFAETIAFGASYRNQDAIIFIIEMKVNENFHIGYAYDRTTSALDEFSNGSHEIMANWRFKIPKIHKGLECPSYY